MNSTCMIHCQCFRSLYDHVFKPSSLPEKGDFHLFRVGDESKWEDNYCSCANGGKWTVISSNEDGLETM